jgi:hypothetical protein
MSPTIEGFIEGLIAGGLAMITYSITLLWLARRRNDD